MENAGQPDLESYLYFDLKSSLNYIYLLFLRITHYTVISSFGIIIVVLIFKWRFSMFELDNTILIPRKFADFPKILRVHSSEDMKVLKIVIKKLLEASLVLEILQLNYQEQIVVDYNSKIFEQVLCKHRV